jgi:hypothetical protein
MYARNTKFSGINKAADWTEVVPRIFKESQLQSGVGTVKNDNRTATAPLCCGFFLTRWKSVYSQLRDLELQCSSISIVKYANEDMS